MCGNDYKLYMLRMISLKFKGLFERKSILIQDECCKTMDENLDEFKRSTSNINQTEEKLGKEVKLLSF